MSRPELAANYRYICADVPMDYLTDNRCEYDISLRIVRFETAPGVFVNLITNLSDHEFGLGDFKELYHLRWCQENAYRDIKYPLCLRALHSKKYEYCERIWERAILHNFSSEIALHVEIDKPDRKYEYRVNYSEAFKTCRDFLRIHDRKTRMGAFEFSNTAEGFVSAKAWMMDLAAKNDKKQIVLGLEPTGHYWFA